MIFALVSKVLGLFREVTLSFFYGTSNMSDIYLIALTIPTVIFSFVGIGLITTYMPVYTEVMQRDGKDAANKLTSNLINCVILICTIVVGIVFIFATPIVKGFASGFEGEVLETAVFFTRISILGIYFMAISNILKGFLEIQKNFIIPAIKGFVFNITLIISIALSTIVDNLILPVGIVAALMLQTILLLPSSRKLGFNYTFGIQLKDKYLKKIMLLSIPVILGVSVNQINVLVDRTIASQITVGGISALNYADKLGFFIQGVFVVSIVTVMYPVLTKLSANNNICEFKKKTSDFISVVHIFLLPATVGSLIFSEQIIMLLFGRGAFDQNAIQMTSNALFYYSIGMIGFGQRQILSRVFYSMQETKTPMINAAIGMMLNIILNIVLSRYIGIGGLALATSIAAIFTSVLLFISLRKKIGSFGMKKISITFLKALIASVLMGIITKLCFELLSIQENLAFLVSIIIGVISYSAIIYFMKIEEVDIVVEIVKSRLGKLKK